MFYRFLLTCCSAVAAATRRDIARVARLETFEVPMSANLAAGDDPQLSTVVFDQGRCQSCSAFVAADLIEASFRRRCPMQLEGRPSVAQLMSCVARSCWQRTSVRDHLEEAAATGLVPDGIWPYDQSIYTVENVEGLPPCRRSREELSVPPHASLRVLPFVPLPDGLHVSALALMDLLLRYGPVAFAAPATWADASRPDCHWFLELGAQAGELGHGAAVDDLVLGDGLARCFESDARGAAEAITHTMLVSGWGFDAAHGTSYWLVKNTWGAAWGASGFFRVERWGQAMGIQTLLHLGYPHALHITACVA